MTLTQALMSIMTKVRGAVDAKTGDAIDIGEEVLWIREENDRLRQALRDWLRDLNHADKHEERAEQSRTALTAVPSSERVDKRRLVINSKNKKGPTE